VGFVLVRIDDRLVHGQVSVAWGSRLKPDRIVLVNDDVACCDWKRKLYGATDSLGAEIVVRSIESFVAERRGAEAGASRDFLIVASPGDLLALIRGGLAIDRANVGGMHFSEGKRKILEYVFVDDDDVAALRAIIAAGVRLEAQDVPQSPSYDVECALDRVECPGQ